VSARGRRTNRRADLSQHFLRKGATPARLVRSTSITSSDLVVEIGPGRGALTLPLAQRARKVIAVELDPFFVTYLRDLLDGKTEIVHGDFLHTPLPRVAYKLLGNPPYTRTTDIIRRLHSTPNPPEDAWLILQREAAQRFVGMPYVDETLWSLRLKPWWHVEIVDRLHRHDFDPPPSVESVLIWFSHRTRPLLTERDTRVFRGITERSYGQGDLRRGTRPWLTETQLRRLSRDLHFEINRNPSSLKFEHWLGLVRFITRTKDQRAHRN